MSAFGDKTLTQDILESLDWIVGEDKKEQLEHVHKWVLLTVDGEYEYLNDYIKDIAKDHKASIKDVQVSLGQIYNYFVEWWELPN